MSCHFLPLEYGFEVRGQAESTCMRCMGDGSPMNLCTQISALFELTCKGRVVCLPLSGMQTDMWFSNRDTELNGWIDSLVQMLGFCYYQHGGCLLVFELNSGGMNVNVNTIYSSLRFEIICSC